MRWKATRSFLLAVLFGAPAMAGAPPEASSLEPLLSAYLQVHAALAGDDLEAAKSAYTALARAAEEVEAEALSAAGAGEELLAELRVASEKGEAAGDLEGARAPFKSLSEAMIELAGKTGVSGEGPYRVAFCPMALGQGARWLQKGEEIENPYFGARMLRCGRVRETLTPGDGGSAHHHAGHEH